jgi:hypothetical protein
MTQSNLKANEEVKEEYGTWKVIQVDNSTLRDDDAPRGISWIVEGYEGNRTDYYDEKRRAVCEAKVRSDTDYGVGLNSDVTEEPKIPVSVVADGKNAVGAYLYANLDTSNPYDQIARHLDVSKQSAKNYVSRFLSE